MKNSTLALLLLIASNLMSNELSWVDEQIQAIKPPRVGMQSRAVSSIKDPFIFLSNSKTKSQTTRVQSTNIVNSAPIAKVALPKKSLSLEIVMNNTAMINGNWYKTGDFIHGYKIVKIGRISVTLNNQNKKLLLSTKSSSNKLKFQK